MKPLVPMSRVNLERSNQVAASNLSYNALLCLKQMNIFPGNKAPSPTAKVLEANNNSPKRIKLDVPVLGTIGGNMF